MRSILRALAPVAVLCPLALSCGKSPPELTFQVTPSATAAVNDGNTPTEIVAVLNPGGQPAPDGVTISFSVDPKTGASFTPISALPSYTYQQTAAPQTANGKAAVTLYDLQVEDVTVTLSASIQTDPTGQAPPVQVNGSQVIHFGGTCSDSFITPASNSGSQSGVATFISLSCNNPAMAGSFSWQTNHPYEGNTQNCTAFVGDGPNQGIANAAVQYITEAGAFETSVQKPGQHSTMLTDSSGEALVNFHVQSPYPEDVPYDPTLDGMFDTYGPTPGVQRWWQDATGHVFNPRDGWVSMAAATAGKLPPGTPPISEPYVDSNDNGQYDPGEPYIDVNCNGQFDAQQTPDSNGYVRIWAAAKILWTGTLYPGSDQIADPGASPSSGPNAPPPGDSLTSGEQPSLEQQSNCIASIQANGTCVFVMRLVDKDLNVPADMGSGNTLAIDSNDQCGLQFTYTAGMDNIYQSQAHLKPANPDFSISAVDAYGGGTPKTDAFTMTITATFNYVDQSNNENGQFGNAATVAQPYLVKGFCQGG